MPVKDLHQVSFFSPSFIQPGCLAEGSVPWALKVGRNRLFPEWLFGDWHGAGRVGRDAWPAHVLMTALLLRSYEGGGSRLGMVKRLERDIVWRAACDLNFDEATPSEATFRRFEAYLNSRDPRSEVLRIQLFHEHLVRLCMNEGIGGDDAVWAMDSTPMWAFGAFQGTVRLLGDGLRQLASTWRGLTARTIEDLAEHWGIPMLLAKSTKGYFRIDWKNKDQRSEVVNQLAQWTLDTVNWVRRNLGQVRHSKRKRLLRLCRRLLKVIAHDLTVDESGRLIVAHRPGGSRIVSFTDPEARAGRKSHSKKYKGYKAHVFGDLVSGLITAIAVAPANVGDGTVAARLLKRAHRLNSSIAQVLADNAYHGAELHFRTRKLHSIDILSPCESPRPKRSDRFNISDFEVDTDERTITCPNDVTVGIRQTPKSRYATWPRQTCADCPLNDRCLPKSGQKFLHIHRYFEELTLIRERWKQPEAREAYRRRAEGERLVSTTIQRGVRKANRWGLQAAVSQVYFAVAANNLILLARKLQPTE